MYKIILLLVLLLSACTPSPETDATTSTSDTPLEITNPVTDPNLFIGAHQAQAMVLGVFHFSNPNLDSYKPKFPFDILEAQRQKELDQLLTKLAAYRPTKILVEWSRTNLDSIVNERYQHYLQDSFDLSDKTNEVYQIGFKLAKKLGHDRIYCSDASASWCGVDIDWDTYDLDGYLKSKGQYEKSMRYDYEAFYQWQDSMKQVQPLLAHLIDLNQPATCLKNHQVYLTEAVLEGAGDHYAGADAVGRWYRRNLRIFANAYDFANFDQEERLLLIYGSGHVWQLRQFFQDSPDFEYVEPNAYLVE